MDFSFRPRRRRNLGCGFLLFAWVGKKLGLGAIESGRDRNTTGLR